MNNQILRATSNLAMLEMLARALGELNDEVVYLGGCATALYITDPLALDVRPTIDVDCIIDVISLSQYMKFAKKLSEKGFKQSMEDNIVCRWHYGEIILDVMPTDGKILGFGNPWYKEALDNAVSHQISDDLSVKTITAPYFIATKIEAFVTRGNNDLIGSHDLEDIITIVAGRVEIVNEISLANDKLQSHLKQFFIKLLKNDQFESVLPGHLNEGSDVVRRQRVEIVKSRIKKIAEIKYH